MGRNGERDDVVHLRGGLGQAEARAFILTGEGKIFSAGGNVKEMADRDGMFGLDPIESGQTKVGVKCATPALGTDLAGATLRISSIEAFGTSYLVPIG